MTDVDTTQNHVTAIDDKPIEDHRLCSDRVAFQSFDMPTTGLIIVDLNVSNLSPSQIREHVTGVRKALTAYKASTGSTATILIIPGDGECRFKVWELTDAQLAGYGLTRSEAAAAAAPSSPVAAE